MQLGLTHSYANLPPQFYRRIAPTAVTRPQVVVFNRSLAADLGLDADAVERDAAALFSGNQLPEDANPIAMAYAGHQFGGFVPQLGDGRAILLGELRGRDGVLRDIQLKGAGQTPFARNGDGRAALGPMLREYLISEAMHALQIPTTRSLCVVATGERVFREGPLPGAVLTRVAASHVRVGTFQYFAARGDQDGLRKLLDYVIERHYPQARDAQIPALGVLQAVSQRQAALIADWMRVGFIHGVMNTDNMAISGETIDYGPCAFMDHYHPNTVFSSIDHAGRYAYSNQPAIAQWNLARLAETLLPFIDSDTDKAVGLATEVLEAFIVEFETQLFDRLCRKIGIAEAREGDAALINRLLAAMQAAEADFTLTFRGLARVAEDPDAQVPGVDGDWILAWRQRLASDPQSDAERAANMRRVNPAVIPRNHRVEEALSAASERGDYEPLRQLLAVLQHPFDDPGEGSRYEQPPMPSERVLQTFCGT